jgi:putative permease
MKKGFIDAVPNRYFEFSLNVLQKMDSQLGNYLRGQFLVALMIGTLSTITLWLLGVDFFLMIGPIAGLMNMIPYVGPIAGGLLAIIASVITSGQFDTIPGIVIAFTAIQIFDNSLLQPLILARNVELHPMLILLAILIGGKLFGIVGLLLAVPFAAILKVIIVETVVNFRRYHLS